MAAQADQYSLAHSIHSSYIATIVIIVTSLVQSLPTSETVQDPVGLLGTEAFLSPVSCL